MQANIVAFRRGEYDHRSGRGGPLARPVVAWNGDPVNFTQLHNNLTAAGTRTPVPELQFEPDPDARYGVVDSVLAIIRRSGNGQLGFVGNERYVREF